MGKEDHTDGFLVALILFAVIGLIGGMGFALVYEESWQVVLGRGMIGAVVGVCVVIWMEAARSER